jgi:hypothetical protein
VTNEDETKGINVTLPTIPRLIFLILLVSLSGISIASMARTDDEKQKDIYSVPKKKPGQGSQAQPPETQQPPPTQQQPGQQQSPGQQPPPTQQQSPAQQQTPAQRQPGLQPHQGSPQESFPQSGQHATQPPPPNIAEHVLSRKLGSEGLNQLLKTVDDMRVQAGSGEGAPNADRWFDNAQPRTSDDQGVRGSDTPVFQGGRTRTSDPEPVTSGAYKPPTVKEAQQTTNDYGSIPGGIVLEGVASGLGEIDGLRYDSRFNAFILNDRSVYFVKVPPKTVALMCRAIAQDEKERVGVSLGQVDLVYGKVPTDSDLAWDLKIADHFLGDIVFAQNDWTRGYRFADGFTPEPPKEESYRVAVFFKFNGFQFQTRQEEILLTRANFDAQILPLSESLSPEGGHLPDVDAISQGRIPQQFELNARHVAEHIAYYRRERIVDKVFVYGEVAAFIRSLKQAGFDLEALADNIPGGR